MSTERAEIPHHPHDVRTAPNPPTTIELTGLDRFITVESVVESIETWLATGQQGMSLPFDIVFDRGALQDLAERLSRRTIVRPKVVKLRRQHRKANVVSTLLAGRFFNDIRWEDKRRSDRKNKARVLADAFLENLTRVDRVPLAQEQERQLLTLEHLEAITELSKHAIYEETKVPGSIVGQLAKPLSLAAEGLRVLPHDVQERNFLLPQLIIEIFRDLRYIESAKTLKEWAIRNIVHEGTLEALTAKIEFLMFLDDSTHFKLWYATEKKVYLLPFQALVKGVEDTIEYLEGLGATIPEELKNAKERLGLRFSQAESMKLTEGLAVEPIMLHPDPKDLAGLIMYDYLKAKDAGIPDTKAAQHIAKTIEKSGIEDVDQFVKSLEDWDIKLAQLVLKELVKLGLVDNEKIIAMIRKETLAILKENPFVDLADMEISDLVEEGEEVDEIHLHLLTCTLGPPHEGHKDILIRQLALIRDLEELDRNNGVKTKRFILVLPITRVDKLMADLDTQDATGYSKKYVDVGSISERLGSLMLLLAGLGEEDRKRVLMTTVLQPEAAVAGTVETAIQETMDNIKKRIKKVLGDNFPVNFSIFMGSDELPWKSDGTLAVTEQQKSKLTEFAFQIAVRHGHLIDTITHWKDLPPNCQAVVLTTDTRQITSTAIKEGIDIGNYSKIPPVSKPFILAHYDYDAISRRIDEIAAGQIQKEKTPSATEICQWLIGEYGRLIGEDGY